MRKIKFLLAQISFFLFFTAPVFADKIDPCADRPTGSVLDSLCKPSTNLSTLVGRGIIYAFIFGAIAALFYLIWGGFKWITSGGDQKGVEGARNHIVAAIIGLIIIFLSYIILNFIVKILTGTDLQNLTFPSL